MIGGGVLFDGFFLTFMVFTVLVDFFVLTVPSGCLPATVVARQLDGPPPALVAGVGLYMEYVVLFFLDYPRSFLAVISHGLVLIWATSLRP